MKRPTEQEYLKAAAQAVERQALENPGLGIPADPDVAEFMGAFEEQAVTLDEVLDAIAATADEE